LIGKRLNVEPSKPLPEKPDELVNLRKRVMRQRIELKRFNKYQLIHEGAWWDGYHSRKLQDFELKMTNAFGGETVLNAKNGVLPAYVAPPELGPISRFFSRFGL
jgi:hypothetical protein